MLFELSFLEVLFNQILVIFISIILICNRAILF